MLDGPEGESRLLRRQFLRNCLASAPAVLTHRAPISTASTHLHRFFLAGVVDAEMKGVYRAPQIEPGSLETDGSAPRS